MQSKDRNTGIDLLKILLALMVISIHFFAPATGAVMNACEIMPMRLFSILMMGMIYPAVNCYVLITAYFSYGHKKSLHNALSGLIKLWIALVMYSVLGYVFTCAIGYQAFSVAEFVKRFFPIIRGEWWFMSVYFALIITAQFILDFIDDISVHTHRLIVILSIITCSIFPFFTKWKEDLGLNMGYSYLWFVVLFIIGTYLKRIKIEDTTNILTCFFGYLSFGILNQVVSFITARVSFLNGYQVATYNSLVVCFQAVFLFLIFVKFRVASCCVENRVIVKLAQLSMASYMFHCQEDIGRWFWETTHPDIYANSYSMFWIYAGTIFGLYILSVIIEIFRRKLIGIGGFDDKFTNGVCYVISKVYGLIDERVEDLFEK